MNKVELLGRLTRDPEVRYTQTNNTLVASFSLAVNRRFVRQGEERQADFINIVAWSKLGEFCSKYFKKGQQVAIIGRIQTRTWDDDQGQKHYVTEVVATNVQFLESRNAVAGGNNFNSMPEPPAERTPYDFAGDNGSTTSNEPQKSNQTMNVEEEKDPFASFGEEIEISDNDLPF